MIRKGASFHSKMMKKTIFKIFGNSSENAFIPVKSSVLQISEDLVFSNSLHHEDHMSTEMC